MTTSNDNAVGLLQVLVVAVERLRTVAHPDEDGQNIQMRKVHAIDLVVERL